MNKIIVLSLLLTIGFTSCNTSTKEIGKLEIAKKYYKFLDKSNGSEIEKLLTDSIIIRENIYDHQDVFSQKGYIEWLKWDSVLEPKYEIIEIELKNEIIKAKISKMDKRIAFLNEEPIVWDEILRFNKDNKIIKVERTKYWTFNDKIFNKNRNDISSWIDQNHPELNSFLTDQSESSGIKYLKAIELYKNRK